MTFKRSFSSTVLVASVIGAVVFGFAAGRASNPSFDHKPPKVETQLPVDSKCATELKSSQGYAKFLTGQLNTRDAHVKELNSKREEQEREYQDALKKSNTLLNETIGLAKEAQNTVVACQTELQKCAGIVNTCGAILDRISSE